MSISVSALVSEKKQNSNFFSFFFFKFTARNYSAQFLSVCVVAVYLSLIKRFTLSTDHGNLSRDPSKTSCSDTRIRTIYSTNSFDISFGFLVVLGSVGSLVFHFLLYFFFSCWFNPIRINLELTNFPGISAIWFHSKKNFVWLVFIQTRHVENKWKTQRTQPPSRPIRDSSKSGECWVLSMNESGLVDWGTLGSQPATQQRDVAPPTWSRLASATVQLMPFDRQ